MKLIRRSLAAFGVLILIAMLGFAVWAETPLGPAPEALAALKSNEDVTITTGHFITFAPARQRPSTTGFIFYPGGRIDPRSYAVPLRAIAAEGYLVILVPVRLNLAVFDLDAAAPVLGAYPEIDHWVIGGHSLGGVAAALFARSHPWINGLVLWASYPADDSLRGSSLRALSIYGTNDMAGTAKFDESRAFLPVDAKYVSIEGGNHAQFADYGAQPGDNTATISRREQQSQVVSATVAFLASFVK